MSDEWFFESRRSRAPRRNWLPVLAIVIVVIVNFAVVAVYVNNTNQKVVELNQEVESLTGQIETLRFQLQSANYEISTLKGSTQIQGSGNASAVSDLTQIYNQTRMSVVLITVQTRLTPGQGSGFVYDKEGRIITNNHVVEDALDIRVTFIDGTIATATVVGTDPYVDLAVIDVDVNPTLLVPVRLGDSLRLMVGERVVALGNPFGLADTMTAGIVSALGRQLNAPGDYAIVDVIQTDAAINPGNSGGPLLNMRGEVIGMNTAIVSDTGQFSGVGFAIPSDTIKREVPHLIGKGRYDHPYFGIRGSGLTPAINAAMGLEEGTKGALVSEVVTGGPADKAGLKGGTREETIEGVKIKVGGDIITGVNGQTVKDLYELVVYVERTQVPWNKVRLTIIRDMQTMELDLMLGVRPAP